MNNEQSDEQIDENDITRSNEELEIKRLENRIIGF